MDLTSRLERLPLGAFHYKLLWVAGLGWMFDAMDTGLISFILPVLAAAWKLTPVQMGYLGSASLVGMALGAVVAGSLADRFGRRRVFLYTMFIYSIATGLCAMAPNYETLLLLRFVVGLGLGGELPVAVTLVSEYAPPRQRGRFIVLLESFWGFGWLAAALISYTIIGRWGWQSGFVIGALPALYTAAARRSIPESVRYLVQKGREKEALRIVEALEGQAGIQQQSVVEEIPAAAAADGGLRDLWSARYRRRTLMLWLIWFGIVYSYYGIFTWLPSLMVGKGMAVVKTFEYILVMTLAQLPGYYTAAWLVDRIGRRGTLASFISLCALTSYGFGHSATPTALLAWGSAMSFFNLGAWGVLYTYTPEQYPTRMRACGSGWAAAIGRIGGIAAPAVVGMFLAGGSGFGSIFTMFAVVMFLVGVVISLIGEETKGKPLAAISE